ncbi:MULTISPECIES: carbon-nitrogen hydrolase [Aneurinibacillus]|uniref:Carbon-nitrogen hydrolase n=1 Tax=Aneurinibacillus thermoaerophilus TaxID=143495 RepID=A0A1G7ZK83_ANETH|nr:MULTISPECIES: carbon-nitrogen hydrolase [Aneurinibacillus]AMA72414.1 N-carbamoylputrescine amidase [Aneurinibacillus sp. XH2]MED0675709.1 carbon-nitrogen hydrolase [Aneurinibacillus thermoaerophilus]MED0679886.1 carbon-nitrogen hydrolase [Aneurinibacillus thermoaerophilus]MED0735610.1 carbon-nitrogen hydrolase [Aneurinibacillus thermoaerophilus]MED0758807.1 carbon-nitrogen hydrolase [Aneurinibacillus thermoaerophilus]
MSEKVTLGLIQVKCGEDIEQNVAYTIEKIEEAAMKGAQIICLQELFNVQYCGQTVSVKGYDLAEPVDSPTLRKMGELAGRLGVVLIVPFYEKAGRGVYFNSAVVFDADGSYLGTTRKNHIPDGPQYHEKYYFIPGNTGYPVYKTRYGTIGIGICWDEWFPEVARILALQGAEILFYPSAIGSEPDHPELCTRRAWEKAISAHGISNGLFVAAVNRVGREKNMTFYGGSFVSNPLGEIMQSLDDEEGILIQEIDKKEIDFARNLLQFLRDRRPETYGLLLKQEALPTKTVFPAPVRL